MASTSSIQDSSTTKVTLERNARRVEININQVTAENLRKIFQVCKCS